MNATERPLRIGALCAGYGGLEIAVRAVLGGELAWVADNDPAAAVVLADRFPGVPNLGDITTVPWEQVEPVDVIATGFPCTDLSVAGLQAGLGPGTRSGVWSRVAKAIGMLRPSLVIVENVRGLLSTKADRGDAPDPDLDPLLRALLEAADAEATADPRRGDLGPDDEDLGDDDASRPVLLRALGAVLGDLAELGFDAEWVGLPASGVGACHGRFRVGVLAWPAAHAAGARRGGTKVAGADRGDAGPGLRGVEPERGGGAPAADAGRDARPQEQQDRAAAGRSGRATADADGIGRQRAGRAEAGRGPGPADDGAAATPDPLGAPRRPWNTEHHDGPPADGGRGPAAPGGRRGAPADPDGGRLGPDQRHLRPGQPDTAGSAAGDSEGERVQDEPVGGAAPGLDVEPVAGAVHRDRERGPAEGVHELGRAAPELAWGPYEPAIRRWELILGRPAPAPTEPGPKGGQRLSPRFVEWMQGLPEGWVTDVSGLTRTDMLRLLGNGVVPQQFTEAVRHLLARAGWAVAA